MTKFSFTTEPQLKILTRDNVETIHTTSLRILEQVGVTIDNRQALEILEKGGCEVDRTTNHALIPQHLAIESIHKAPSAIHMQSLDGKHNLELTGNRVYYDPGSSALFYLDHNDAKIRRPTSQDLADLVRLTDALENVEAQSTAMVVSDVPDTVVDRYRLYIVLKNSAKTIITGTFSIDGVPDMRRMLEAVVGGEKKLRNEPLAIFDCCPSAPLKWSEITAQNLIDCAKWLIPSEIAPVPQLGATSPATIAGSIAQLNAEFLSGLVIAQLAQPGAPVIYGGSPTTFDMRYATPRLGAIETIITDCAYAQIGKYYGLPTHAYLGISDSKLVDAQTGIEASLGLVLGALAGINVISGPGMLYNENCQSLEKLVLDDAVCGMAKRLVRGVEVSDQTLAFEAIRKVGSKGHFLALKHTNEWFRKEQFMPSAVIDRQGLKPWLDSGAKDAYQRARESVDRILRDHKPQPLVPECEKALNEVTREILSKKGVGKMPLGP